MSCAKTWVDCVGELCRDAFALRAPSRTKSFGDWSESRNGDIMRISTKYPSVLSLSLKRSYCQDLAFVSWTIF
jgi:hypothetical protein